MNPSLSDSHYSLSKTQEPNIFRLSHIHCYLSPHNPDSDIKQIGAVMDVWFYHYVGYFKYHEYVQETEAVQFLL